MKTLDEGSGLSTRRGTDHGALFIPESMPGNDVKALDCVCDGGQDCAPDRGKRLTTTLAALFPWMKARKAKYETVMAYRFDPLIYRMVDKHGWDEAVACEVFEEFKRYAWLCATTGEALAPTKIIDEMWHNFILFTEDYQEFCRVTLGRFFHHRPTRRGQIHGEDNGESATQKTTRMATEAFGTLSKYWMFPK